MAGFTPNEGRALIAQVCYQRTSVDRDADLELGLFTNSSVGSTTTHASLTEPTGTGYARITLTDGNWSLSGNVMSYPLQTFTGGSGGWTGSVRGYFINSKSAGGTKRLLHLEVDENGPYTIAEGSTYKITPNIKIS